MISEKKQGVAPSVSQKSKLRPSDLILTAPLIQLVIISVFTQYFLMSRFEVGFLKYVSINCFPDDGTLKCSGQACLSHILAVSPEGSSSHASPINIE